MTKRIFGLRVIATLFGAAAVAICVTACGKGPGGSSTVARAPTAETDSTSSKDFGDYNVHFNAISTDRLSPEVAKNYNIVRSKNRAMLNVSIIKKVAGTPGVPVPGTVAVQVANLNGQIKDFTLREIKEADAVYYIADIPVSNGEQLVFTVDVTPVNETNRYSVKFNREFYGD
jgi:Domain of unknown function (DUF4426)